MGTTTRVTFARDSDGPANHIMTRPMASVPRK